VFVVAHGKPISEITGAKEENCSLNDLSVD